MPVKMPEKNNPCVSILCLKYNMTKDVEKNERGFRINPLIFLANKIY